MMAFFTIIGSNGKTIVFQFPRSFSYFVPTTMTMRQQIISIILNSSLNKNKCDCPIDTTKKLFSFDRPNHHNKLSTEGSGGVRDRPESSLVIALKLLIF
jgi:hypothetical protein